VASHREEANVVRNSVFSQSDDPKFKLKEKIEMKHKMMINPVLILSIMLASVISLIYVPVAKADSGGIWQARASMLQSRTWFGAAVSGGKIYVFGGLGSSNPMWQVEVYDPTTNVWQSRTSMPTPRKGVVTVTAANGKIYVMGGANSSHVNVNTVEEYDATADTWRARAGMPESLGFMSAVMANGKIYTFGGFNGTTPVNTVQEYDPDLDTWQTRANMPTARYSLSAVFANGKIYAIGGQDNLGVIVSTVEEYDPNTDTWATRANMPTPRCQTGAALAVNGRIYVIGGGTCGNTINNIVEEYNPLADSWNSETSMPTARQSLNAVSLGGKIYAIGGDILSGIAVSTVEEFTPPAATTNLSAVTNNSEIYPGDPVTVDLNIHNASDLYAAQAACSVNPVVLQLQNGAFGEMFDPVNRLVGANNADAAAGTWLGAISQRSPALPLSGNGIFATVTYLAQNPGTTAITCEPLLSDRNGFAQSVTYTGANITVLAFGILKGTVQYQGRLDATGIMVTAAGVVNLSGLTNSVGAFSLNQLKAGTYQVRADAPKYLPLCAANIVVNSGQNVTLAATMLLGGDLNDDDAINIGDASRIGSAFGTSDPAADINGDGIVNVQDLAILAGNYDVTGCQSW
jgi:N-acetylneuraminic acid mutarotase